MIAFKAAENNEFLPCPIEIDEHFDEIIGVTYINDAPVETVVFAESPREIQFILTKPLHSTQRCPTQAEQEELHAKYPNVPSDWLFVTIDCKWNFELITLLFSYGERIVVLSPEKVVEDLKTKLKAMSSLY